MRIHSRSCSLCSSLRCSIFLGLDRTHTKEKEMEFCLMLCAGALALRAAPRALAGSDHFSATTAAGDGAPMMTSHAPKIASANARRMTGYTEGDIRRYAYARDDWESRRPEIITQIPRTQVNAGFRDPASLRYGGMQCDPEALDGDYAAKRAFFTDQGMCDIDLPQTTFLNPYHSHKGNPCPGMKLMPEQPLMRQPFA